MTPEKELVSLLSARSLTFACAESCTGGMIAERITRVPGASAVFLGGVVSYAYSVKEKVLGVSAEVLAEKGAFCDEVAEQMAEGVRTLTGADVSASTTGVAGPGPAEGKPAGLVYTAVSFGGKTVVAENRFFGTREEVRAQAAAKAMEMAIEIIAEKR